MRRPQSFRFLGRDLPILRLPGMANAPPWAPYAAIGAGLVFLALLFGGLNEGAAPAGPGQYDAASGEFMNISGGIPAPVDIPIQNLTQETEVWCWAAVAQQIILASQGPQATPPQCALVAMANGAPPEACCSGYNAQCVRTGSLQQIQQLIQQFGGRPTALAPPTDPMTLYGALAQGRPVILALQSGQGSGHVVVVRGMSFVPTANGVEPVLHVNDPMAYYTQPVAFRDVVAMWSDAIVVR
jgi:hypothetical protein